MNRARVVIGATGADLAALASNGAVRSRDRGC
jgi:hypothetical protein